MPRSGPPFASGRTTATRPGKSPRSCAARPARPASIFSRRGKKSKSFWRRTMISCNAADFLYRLLPVKPWRGFLIRVHFDRCPHCQKQLAGAAEARTLFVQEADFRPGVALWQGMAGSLDEEDGATPEKPRV